MASDTLTIKHPKARKVTLREARAAMRSVQGDRPSGKLVVVKSGRSKALREKYLGQIVLTSAKHGSSARVSSTKRTATNPVARAKKK